MRLTVRYLCAILLPLLAMTQARAEDSSTLTPPQDTPNSVFLLEQGYINQPSAPNQEQQTFATTKACPPDFNPYVVIRMSKMATNGRDVVRGFGVCVNGIKEQEDAYAVAYLISRRYADAYTSSNANRYVSDSDWAYTVWNTHPMPPTTYMSNTGQDFSQQGGFYWSLYCYPQGQQPPLNEQSDSSNPNNPYNNGCAGGGSAITNPY